jgi:hypothetical protein
MESWRGASVTWRRVVIGVDLIMDLGWSAT